MNPEPEIVEGEIEETPEEPGTALARPEPGNLFHVTDPVAVIDGATRVATALTDVLRKQKLITNISGREHVRVEGWVLLGSMLGCFPVVVWTRQTEQGWEARVEVRTRDGAVIGAAEASCDRTERTWAKRDSYALRSMAQTRATSKAMRGPLGFIVTMAGFEATPAEEMDGVAAEKKPEQSSRPKPPPREPRPPDEDRPQIKDPDAPASDAQVRKLSILAREKGLEDRAERLQAAGALIGRELDSFKSLTKGEASDLIERWTAEAPGAAESEAGGGEPTQLGEASVPTTPAGESTQPPAAPGPKLQEARIAFGSDGKLLRAAAKRRWAQKISDLKHLSTEQLDELMAEASA